MLLMLLLVSSGSTSLLAHSVHANSSPTYADLKDSGRVRTGEMMKLLFASAAAYASEALGWICIASSSSTEGKAY